MVSFIINWCLNNRFMVMLLTAVLGIAGYYCMINTPVGAIPDIGEKKVVVFVDWPGRSPQDVEDQITYPLTISLQGTPQVKSIRSASGFGFSNGFPLPMQTTRSTGPPTPSSSPAMALRTVIFLMAPLSDKSSSMRWTT